jgi:hypothetical protein
MAVMVNDDSQKDGKTHAGKGRDDTMDVVDQVLRNDAEGLLRELDDPQEVRRWFDSMMDIVEQQEREAVAEPPDEEADDALEWT